MDKPILKTSEEWNSEDDIIILDPDGWDRSPEGWYYSFYEELITREEYYNRLCKSTCKFTIDSFERLEDELGRR